MSTRTCASGDDLSSGPPAPELGAASACGRRALVHALILIGLCAWMFWPQVVKTGKVATSNVDWAHALVCPLAILVLLYRRRCALAGDLGNGSTWGVVLLLAALGLYALASWPFPFGYVGEVQFVTALAGVALAIGGWGVLKRCLPMLLLLFVSMPIGSSIYAFLSIRPETWTLDVCRLILDQLPGVDVELRGPDLIYDSAGAGGAVALGQPHRGVSMLMAYLGVGIFVVFARIRPLWQVVLLALAAVPVVLLCNLFRLVTQGLGTIYTDISPVSSMPRNTAAVVSLLLAYGMFSAATWVVARLVVVDEGADDEQETQGGFAGA